jgi:hypothetical protein
MDADRSQPPLCAVRSRTSPALAAGVPDIDVEGLKCRIREEVARRRAAKPQPLPTRTNGFAGRTRSWPGLARSWHDAKLSLKAAEQFADVGLQLPELARLRGWMGFPARVLARLLARCVLYLSRFLTNRQRQFNVCTLDTIHHLQEVVRRLEQTQRASMQGISRHLQRQPEEANRLQAEVLRYAQQVAQLRGAMSRPDGGSESV